MQEIREKEEDLEQKIFQIYEAYGDDLHSLGLGENQADKEKSFDFKNFGLSEKKEKQDRGEFKFDYDLEKIRKIISYLEDVLRIKVEDAWQMKERENGRLLESCFSGLEYLEDPKELFATLVFRLTKNHPCEDGNKRISCVVFVLGLLENGMSVEEIKQIVDLEEFGLVMSQIENSKQDEVRAKIKNFLVNIGYK